jgi:pimeloyl-ACP methyl ester carboxylesterase
MKIVRKSYFKKPDENKAHFRSWVDKLEKMNGYEYEKITLNTGLGSTQVYGLNTNNTNRETLVIFPGFRTTSLIWDLDKGLEILAKEFRIYLVETNGQPNLSEGNTPEVKSLDYGRWGEEVFDELGIDKAYIAGASFGGLICMKIAICIPGRIKAAILLNPGCFRFVSLGYKNMYYNILPLVKPSVKNISKFLDMVVFHKPYHKVSGEAEQHLIDYLSLAIQYYKDNTQKPYYMKDQLDQIQVDTYMILGENDILLPFKKSVTNAKKHLGENLKQIYLEKSGHGIELHSNAIRRVFEIIKEHSKI